LRNGKESGNWAVNRGFITFQAPPRKSRGGMLAFVDLEEKKHSQRAIRLSWGSRLREVGPFRGLTSLSVEEAPSFVFPVKAQRQRAVHSLRLNEEKLDP
jgi:hypothetical protein